MKILAIQNRMGIGDTVIFLPYIQSISKKFNSPVSLLVKESSKSEQYLDQTDYIDEIILLKRNKNFKTFRHNGLMGIINLAADLRKYKFQKIFIFNSSLRYRLIAKLSGIKEIYQFPLFKKKGQDMIKAAEILIHNKLKFKINSDPIIQIKDDRVENAVNKFKISKNYTNILLGIGGSGPTKRIPAETYLSVMKKISKIKDCKFFLATGQNIEEQLILKKIINSEFRNQCIALDNLSIKDCLPVIKKCDISVCNDTSFSHLSSALGINTITLMADTPIMYGNYSSKMYPIIPDGETTVSHNTLGKDKINPDKIFDKLISILN